MLLLLYIKSCSISKGSIWIRSSNLDLEGQKKTINNTTTACSSTTHYVAYLAFLFQHQKRKAEEESPWLPQ